MKQCKIFGQSLLSKLLFLTLLFSGLYVYAQEHVRRNDFSRLNVQIDSLCIACNIPGIQLAIMKNEAICYKQTYGFASVETQETVTDTSLFRIASISKPITAIAILKLVAEGKLKLDQFVFGAGDALLGKEYPGFPYSERISQITVRHLLEHKSGWTNNPDDPMFCDPEVSQHKIIADLLLSRTPEYEPSQKYYYLNVGYCILGRIIEKVTGLSYETYVLQHILNPCGITHMCIGGNTPDQRKPHEVMYYSNEATTPYEMNITRMDAHGGWLASAGELLLLMSHIDRNPRIPDLLSADKLQIIYLGYEKWIHTGSLPGSTTMLVRNNDQFSYCILTNTRQPYPDSLVNKLQRLMEDNLKQLH